MIKINTVVLIFLKIKCFLRLIFKIQYLSYPRSCNIVFKYAVIYFLIIILNCDNLNCFTLQMMLTNDDTFDDDTFCLTFMNNILMWNVCEHICTQSSPKWTCKIKWLKRKKIRNFFDLDIDLAFFDHRNQVHFQFD